MRDISKEARPEALDRYRDRELELALRRHQLEEKALGLRYRAFGASGSILEADARVRVRLPAGVVEEVVDLVPEAWFAGGDEPGVSVDYLSARLAGGAFVQEAERARIA